MGKRFNARVAVLLALGLGLAACLAPGLMPVSTPVMASPDDLYVVVPGQVRSRLAVLDHSTLMVKVERPARGQPYFLPAPDPRYVFVLDSWISESRVSGQDLSKIDIATGQAAWTTSLPGFRPPYIGIPFGDEIWTSDDGRYVYVVMDRNPVRLTVVDGNNGRVEREINTGLFGKKMWKLPWFETMLLISGRAPWSPTFDEPLNLVSLDLAFGVQQTLLQIPGWDDRSPVPKNLSQEVFIVDGELAEETRTLYLATSRQEVVRVKLFGELTAGIVLKLPSGWQFMSTDALSVSEDGKRIYLGVRPTSAPITWTLLGEEVWAYDTDTWQKVGDARPEGGFLNMRLSRDGQRLYALNPATSTLSLVDAGTMTQTKVNRALVGGPFDNNLPFVWIIYPR